MLSNLLIAQVLRLRSISTLINSDDDGTTESEVVLQASGGLWNSTVVSPSSQVPNQLSTLSNTRSTKWVALGNQTSRWVNDVFAPISDISISDQLVSLALWREPESIDNDHLVGGETVVNLDNLHVVWSHLGLLHGDLDGVGGHLVAHEVDCGLGEEGWCVGGEALARDEDGLGLEVRTGVEEVLRNQNSSSSSIRGWAALELGERSKDHRCVHDLLLGVNVLELGVWVALGVLVVDARDLSKIWCLSSVLLHILATCVSEHLCGAWGVGDTAGLGHHAASSAGWVLAIVPKRLKRSWVHLLESNNHHAVSSSVCDDITGEMETGRAGRAVVVDVVDWDLGHAELVEDALAAGGVAVAVAGDSLVDVVVVDLGVEKGLDSSLEAEFGVVDLSAWLDELGHADAENVDWLRWRLDHFGGCAESVVCKGYEVFRLVYSTSIWSEGYIIVEEGRLGRRK